MILESKVNVKEKDMECCRKFAETTYWRGDCEDLYSDDFVLDLPYAPPGMYQHLGKNELKWHYDWLSHTVADSWVWENCKALGTNHPGRFWVFRKGSGPVLWGGKEGWYESRFATLLEIKDGRITYAKDHFDPVGFYKAIGVELPRFYYDGGKPSAFPEWKTAVKPLEGEEAIRKQVEETLNFFVSPDYWNPEVNDVLAEDFVHELTFAPADMPRIYRGREYDALNEWLDRHLKGGTIYDEIFYETTDPHIYITEYNCLFETDWGYTAEQISAGAHGRYPNREISYIELDDNGRCRRLDEYLNTVSKFLSTNTSIPTFPYMYY